MEKLQDLVAVIAAGGEGTRVRPLLQKATQSVFDKPAIYYFLTNVMKAGIGRALVVCSQAGAGALVELLNTGWEFGMDISICVGAPYPGAAGVFKTPAVRRFVEGHRVCLMLDGFYDGGNFDRVVQQAAREAGRTIGCIVLAARLKDAKSVAETFGWMQENSRGQVVNIYEKPPLNELRLRPGQKDFLVQTHMYFYGTDVLKQVDEVQPRKGQYEITDLHNIYRKQEQLKPLILTGMTGKRGLWDDAGTSRKLLRLAKYVEKRQPSGTTKLIGSPHLQALDNDWIEAKDLKTVAKAYAEKTKYFKTLDRIATERISLRKRSRATK
ncbi:MAG: sugar phosphate nucleotidyltransferase [Planctomycetota bacterium]